MNTDQNGVLTESFDIKPKRRDIVLIYFKIGAIGFGVGYAVMDLIYDELVKKRGWLTAQRFQNAVALSEMAPGALTVNLMAGIAYRLGGIQTMILATTALILPSFVLILALAGLFLAWQHHPLVSGALTGLTAGVVGLLLAAVVDLIKKAPRHWCCFVVGMAALLIGFIFPINPIWLVLMGGIAGTGKGIADKIQRKRNGAASGDDRSA
ncbi:MAG: chromate transporter [Desulfobacteraceae bacterium]|nr:chromate transporter [Desulfobacteraceae bacterium]